MDRVDHRGNTQLRPLQCHRNFTRYAQGSVLMEMGETKLIVSAFYENKVPPFLKGTGQGWLSAEYNMLPSSTQTRKARDISRLRLDGRSAEIQRLIGRSLRSCLALEKLGENTIWIDCDVIQADGGTRCAGIIGGFIALWDCVRKMLDTGVIPENPIEDFVGAVSVGIVEDTPLTDLCYEEDSHAQADMNVVMSGQGGLIEVQATGEQRPVSAVEFDGLLKQARAAILEIIAWEKTMLL